MQSQQMHSAPRGNSTEGAWARHRCDASDTSAESASQEPATLFELLGDKHVIAEAADHIMAYSQRNTSFEIQKAMAITIMAMAITKWGCNITEAARRAADCSGFSAETVRLWASSFIISTSTIAPDNITDEYITEQLATNRGAHDTHTGSLLHDEQFQLAARSYVRKHACRKGAPNLTSKMFADWIESEYGRRVHDDTARRWLGKLGFARVHHQKGVYFDGHDRDDVVMYRDEFLATMLQLDHKSLTCYNTIPREGTDSGCAR